MSRSKYKGLFFNLNLIKKKNNHKIIKVLNKNLIILPEYINLNFSIYNGKNFIKIKIVKEMVNYKFGEFINTRKRFTYKKK